jgi:hypothetical protein
MVTNDAVSDLDSMKRKAVDRLLAWRFPPKEIAATLGLPVQTVLELQESCDQRTNAENSNWTVSGR